MKEKQVQAFYAKNLDGAMEVPCNYGRIDILTPEFIVEVKKLGNYKSAIGQLMTYQLDYPDRKLLLIAFSDSIVQQSSIDTVVKACNSLGIELILHDITAFASEPYKVTPAIDYLVPLLYSQGVKTSSLVRIFKLSRNKIRYLTK